MANFQSPDKNSNYSGSTISSWSRQQKLAMLAGFVILGFLIAMSACSKQASKPALVGVSAPLTTPSAPAVATTPTPTQPAPVAKKKAKKRPAAIVTYSDPNSGVSFRYPRKYELAGGSDISAPSEGSVPVPMNFVQAGGTPVASVTLPAKSYPGTDFSAAFFNVNVNRSLSEQECSQFAVVDSSNADGEALNPEKVEVGAMQLDKTADFSGDGMQQTEAQYYHRYENGACYEFVLGLDTAGFGTDAKIEAVNRDEVFAKLGKILESVKFQAVEVEKQQVAATTAVPEQEVK
ncbi:MAG TPA: hypothetical protein VMH31_15590 [Methylomirabilota bacterium]|nr:hypothetical protein [Methylomirabilota bacterium]